MQRKNIIILGLLLAAILTGMLSIGVGLILGFVLGSKWFYISLAGILLITTAVAIIVFEIKRLRRMFRNGLSPEMRELLKRTKR